MTSTTPITVAHLAAAEELAKVRATAEFEDGEIIPKDDVWEIEDEQDIIFVVTGEKIAPNTEQGQLIIDAYENGYFEQWEEFNG